MQSTPHTLSQAALSESNRSHVLHHLHGTAVSSRAQISRALGLTPAAITKITAKLLDDGLIEQTPMPALSSTVQNKSRLTGASSRAPQSGRSVGLRLRCESFHVIGIKFARSLLQIGTFDLAGNQLSLSSLPTVTESTIAASIQDLRKRIMTLLQQDPSIVAVGMAVPGPYLRGEGRTAVVSSMNSWRRVNFRNEFSTLPVPVFIEQDARAGALAEHLFMRHDEGGAAQTYTEATEETTTATTSKTSRNMADQPISTRHNAESLAYYLLGEGVGLGVIEDGRLIAGHQGTATELGHVSIDVHGMPCECGNRGCLEQYCSAMATHRIMQEQDYPGISGLSPRGACEQLFTDSRCASTALRTQAAAIIAQVGRYAGYGCVTIINAYNPKRIVIGDILSHAGAPLLQAVREVVRSRVIPEIYDSTSIELSKLPTDSTVSGAAAVAITAFLDNPSRFIHIRDLTTNGGTQTIP